MNSIHISSYDMTTDNQIAAANLKRIIEDLLSDGYNQESIARELEIQKSVFSNIYKKIIPRVISGDSDYMLDINNVKKNIADDFVSIALKLKAIRLEKREVKYDADSYFKTMRNATYGSYKTLIQSRVIGLYVFHYRGISFKETFCIPTLIFDAGDGSIGILLGSNTSYFPHEGTCMLTNKNVLNIFLSNSITSLSYNMLLLFSIPLLKSFEIMTGTFTTVGPDYQTAAGKCVLRKITNEYPSVEDFLANNYGEFNDIIKNIPRQIEEYFSEKEKVTLVNRLSMGRSKIDDLLE